MIPLRPALLLTAVLLTVDDGCGSPTQARRVHDPHGAAYRLATIDGRSLPFSFAAGLLNRIDAAELCLFPDGEYRLSVSGQASLGPTRDMVSEGYGSVTFTDGVGTINSTAATLTPARDTVRIAYPAPTPNWVFVAAPSIVETACLVRPAP